MSGVERVPGADRTAEPASSQTPALEVDGLAYSYPDGHPALAGVDLRVAPGERVALLGPNGAGKTTLVLHLNGILPGREDVAAKPASNPAAKPASNPAAKPAAGTVRVGGLPVAPDTLAEVRRRVGLVFQDPDDQLFMPTVRDDVAFGPANLGLRGAELAARVSEALDVVGLRELADRPPHHLSFGQRRRAAIATVLAMRPQVLVLDEPTSNLDPASRRDLVRLLQRLGVTTLTVTHDLPFALEVCPRSVILSEGRVVADGPTRDLLADAGLLARHRLELPYGFDPALLTAAPPARA